MIKFVHLDLALVFQISSQCIKQHNLKTTSKTQNFMNNLYQQCFLLQVLPVLTIVKGHFSFEPDSSHYLSFQVLSQELQSYFAAMQMLVERLGLKCTWHHSTWITTQRFSVVWMPHSILFFWLRLDHSKVASDLLDILLESQTSCCKLYACIAVTW